MSEQVASQTSNFPDNHGASDMLIVLSCFAGTTSAVSWYQSQSFCSRQELVTSFHTLLTKTLVACTETSRLFEAQVYIY